MAGETTRLAVAIDATGARVGAAHWAAATARVNRGALAAAKNIATLDAATKAFGLTATRVKMAVSQLFLGFGAYTAIKMGIGTMASFEQQMQRVKAVSKATGDEFAALKEQARLMGATTRFTAGEAAQGLYYLSLAGYKAGESIEALPHTLNLASAAQMDLGRTADHVSNILRAFRMETSETERVADVLAVTTTSSNTSVEQMAQALKFAGPMAAATGASIEEVAGLIGTLGDAGIQATMAGTGLRQMFVRLLDPTKEALGVMQKYEINPEMLDPTKNSLIQIMSYLGKKDINTQDFVDLFNTRAANAGLVLREDIEKTKALAKATTEYTHAAREMSNIIEDSLAGSFRAFRSALSEAVLQIGDSGFLGALRNTMDGLTDMTRLLAGMDEQYIKNIERAEQWARVLKTVGAAIGSIIAWKVGTVFLGWAQSILTATTSMRAFAAICLTNPFGLVATGAAMAVIAVTYYGDELVELNDKTATLRSTTKSWLKELRDGATIGRDHARMAASVGWTGAKMGYGWFKDQMSSRFAAGAEMTRRIINGEDLTAPWMRKKPTDKPSYGDQTLIGAMYDDTTSRIMDRAAEYDQQERDKKEAERKRGEERRRRLTELEKERDARDKEIRAMLESRIKDTDELPFTQVTDKLKEAESVGEGFIMTMMQGITNMARETDNLGEAIARLMEQMSMMFLQEAVMRPIAQTLGAPVGQWINSFSGGIGNGLAARGAASGGGFDLAAYNSILSSPTGVSGAPGANFNLSTFNSMIAAPTAAKVIQRGGSGVGGLGDGSASPGNTVNINMNVSTPDARSFRENSRQVSSKLRGVMGN